MHLPNLDPYPGCMPVRSETVDDYEYEEISDGQQICPERHANIFDSKLRYIIFFWSPGCNWLNGNQNLQTSSLPSFLHSYCVT